MDHWSRSAIASNSRATQSKGWFVVVGLLFTQFVWCPFFEFVDIPGMLLVLRFQAGTLDEGYHVDMAWLCVYQCLELK